MRGHSAMAEHATHLTIENIRSQIDLLLDALVKERDDETVQRLQELASLERQIEGASESPADGDWS